MRQPAHRKAKLEPGHQRLDPGNDVDAAEKLKYIGALKRTLSEQFHEPDDEWVKFLAGRVYDKAFTKRAREQFTPLVREAAAAFLDDQVNVRLKKALESTRPQAEEDEVTSEEVAQKVREVDSSSRLENPLSLAEMLPERPYWSSPALIREMEDYYRTLARVYEDLDKKYDALLIVGGSGPIVDLANNQRVHDLILGFRQMGKPIGAECYGVACLAFARNLLAPTLVEDETVAEMTTVQFPGLSGVLPDFGRFDPLDWGLGVHLNSGGPSWMGVRTSPRAFGHIGGSGTFLWVDPEVGVACAALTTREFGDWAKAAWPALSDAVLDELSASA